MQTEVPWNTSTARNHDVDGWSPSLTGCLGLTLFQIAFMLCLCPKCDVSAIINCPNAGDKAPPEFVRNLIALRFRQIQQISLPLLTHFHFFLLHPPLWLIHPDTYFHNSGWSSHFFTRPIQSRLTTKVSDFILFSPASSSSASQHGGSSDRTWQKKRKVHGVQLRNPHAHCWRLKRGWMAASVYSGLSLLFAFREWRWVQRVFISSTWVITNKKKKMSYWIKNKLKYKNY